MAAFFAGVAGGLFGHQSTLSPSELGFQRSIDIVIMVVLGGMGSISGAVLAAFLLTLMPEIFREFKPEWMLIYVAVIFGATVWQRFLGAKDAWKTHWRSKLIHRGIAVALAVTLQVRRDWAGEISHYRMIVYALVLILIMIARPQGLFGTNEIWETNWWRRLFGRAASKTTPTSSEAP
jgi:ABC-type branched-subunit amino acid transport system permease subunit